eukprot:COSAG02_NODE_4721_length_5052_cov_14.669695_6_plen_182_part_00
MAAAPKILLQPNQDVEATSLLNFYGWCYFAIDFQRPELRQALKSLGLTLATVDSEVDRLVPCSFMPVRPRGETTPGFALAAEFYSGMIKAFIALTAEDSTEAQELAPNLPSWDEAYALVCARYVFCVPRSPAAYIARIDCAYELTFCYCVHTTHYTAYRSRFIMFVEVCEHDTNLSYPVCC